VLWQIWNTYKKKKQDRKTEGNVVWQTPLRREVQAAFPSAALIANHTKPASQVPRQERPRIPLGYGGKPRRSRLEVQQDPAVSRTHTGEQRTRLLPVTPKGTANLVGSLPRGKPNSLGNTPKGKRIMASRVGERGAGPGAPLASPCASPDGQRSIASLWAFLPRGASPAAELRVPPLLNTPQAPGSGRGRCNRLFKRLPL